MKLWKTIFLWYLGGAIYMTLEFIWRDYSHYTMFCLGGACFLLLCGIFEALPDWPLVGKVCLGACCVTVLEFLSGMLLNRVLGMGIWSYEGLPLNLCGQVCIYYFVLWIPVCLAGMLLWRFLRAALQTPRPRTAR